MIADLHIHSRFSRACSKDITIPNLVKWAKIKGLHLLGTGDFTHPEWLKEIKKFLEPNSKGFYLYQGFPFILSSEISLMYTQGKGRRIHLVLLAPSLEIVEKINSYFDNFGRRDYDGRPIFSMSAEKLVKDLKEISDEIEIIPAHIWTPWFGVFGSMSGFDSLKECFKSQVEKIHAIETGLSSDPPMNWKIKELEDKTILSFSDSHSFWPWRLGREATIFQKTDSYSEIIKQIRQNSIIATIEVDPAYGKYHWDGHRLCNFSSSPQKTKELEGICPVCHKPLTIGVENRVESLSNNKEKPKNAKPFYKLLPLHEIISLAATSGINTKKVWSFYNTLIEKFGNEFNVLFDASLEELLKTGISEKVASLILKNREGKINVEPGFDGEYGRAILEKQKTLF